MYRVGVRRPMDVGHYLVGDFGDETVPHRHDYVVEWICRRGGLDPNGFSIDIAEMENCLETTSSDLAGKLLNDIPFFADMQPSVENFARYVFVRLGGLGAERGLPADVMRGAEVIVWENDSAWASYSDDL